ncbi:hypothetical protein Tco_0070264, partial [Tanacetum coccineum]
KRSARVGAKDPVTGMDNGTESTGDLHLLRDSLAKCEDKCMGLSDESPDDDSDVVGGYKVDNGAAHQRRNASLRRGALLGGKKMSDDLKNEVMHASMLICELVKFQLSSLAVTGAIENSDDDDGCDATLLLQ